MFIKSKYFLNIIFISLLPGFSIAQSYEQKYIGIIKLEGNNKPLTYMLEYNVQNGKIEGVSYSDIGKTQETKSKIKGSINGKSIKIEEYEIIHSSDNSQSFCFLHLEGKLESKKRGQGMNGKFKGYINNLKNRSCGIGTFMLLEQSKIVENRGNIEKIIDKIDTNNIVQQNNLLLEKSKITLYTNAIKQYHTDDAQVEIIIKDFNNIDGDNISIYNNDVLLLDNYTINHENKSIIIQLHNAINKIKIIANNEGNEFPNTAGLIFKDKNRAQSYQLKMHKLDSCIVEIIKL